MASNAFKIRVEIKAFRKGDEARVFIEEYDNWAHADAAYCAYSALVPLKQSYILAVDLIEVKQEVLHKSVSKLKAAA